MLEVEYRSTLTLIVAAERQGSSASSSSPTRTSSPMAASKNVVSDDASPLPQSTPDGSSGVVTLAETVKPS